jgi:hypothetical protein
MPEVGSSYGDHLKLGGGRRETVTEQCCCRFHHREGWQGGGHQALGEGRLACGSSIANFVSRDARKGWWLSRAGRRLGSNIFGRESWWVSRFKFICSFTCTWIHSNIYMMYTWPPSHWHSHVAMDTWSCAHRKPAICTWIHGQRLSVPKTPLSFESAVSMTSVRFDPGVSITRYWLKGVNNMAKMDFTVSTTSLWFWFLLT